MNNPNNLITTIIPTYNRSSILNKTIRNVLEKWMQQCTPKMLENVEK